MKNKIIFSVLFLISSQVYAQPRPGSLSTVAQKVTDTIRYYERSLTRDQSIQISQKLSEIQNILLNQPGTGYPAMYSCVSRDNDNRAPYVFGMRSGLNIIRVTGAVFSTIEECNQTINELVLAPNTANFMSCLSSDNDGRSPYSLSLINGEKIIRVSGTRMSSLSECKSLLKNITFPQGYYTEALFCGTRDNDGRAPYAAFSLDLNTGVTKKGSESFSDMQSCLNFIR